MPSADLPNENQSPPNEDKTPAPLPARPAAAAVEPSGPRGDNPGTADPGPAAVKSLTPENSTGHLNPSAPEDSNTTPGSTSNK